MINTRRVLQTRRSQSSATHMSDVKSLVLLLILTAAVSAFVPLHIQAEITSATPGINISKYGPTLDVSSTSQRPTDSSSKLEPTTDTAPSTAVPLLSDVRLLSGVNISTAALDSAVNISMPRRPPPRSSTSSTLDPTADTAASTAGCCQACGCSRPSTSRRLRSTRPSTSRRPPA